MLHDYNAIQNEPSRGIISKVGIWEESSIFKEVRNFIRFNFVFPIDI